VRWKGANGSAVTLATVEIKPKEGRLEIAWVRSEMKSNPLAAQAAYWMLESATMVVDDAAGKRPQAVRYSPMVIEHLLLTDANASLTGPGAGLAKSTITWPAELPEGVSLVNKGVLPEGWLGTWRPEFDPNDGAADPSRVVHNMWYKKVLDKPFDVAGPAMFELVITDKLGTAQSNLALREREAEHDNASMKMQADKEQDAKVKEDKLKLAAGYAEAITAYRALKGVELDVLMPDKDKTPVATLRFERQ
jgi:hypothetical protein